MAKRNPRIRSGRPVIPHPSPEAAKPLVPVEREPGPSEGTLDRKMHAAIGRMAGGFSPMGLFEAWTDWAVHLAVSPGRMTSLVASGMKEAAHLGGILASAVSNRGVCEPCLRALPHDRRFRDERWSQWPFAFHASSLLAWERWWDEATRGIHGATSHHLTLLNFVGRQFLDTLSPSNFPWSNPEVLDATIETRGANLLQGAGLALDDAVRALRNQRPGEAQGYRPGERVALTPGRVVFRNRLVEIIQYAPSTPTTHREPVVIVPAWIMKYYILDLSPENSLVRHLVDAGFTVFMISWKNPGLDDRDLGFDHYRQLGAMAAIDAATAVTGVGKVHAVGYCIGGTLLAVAAAAMARDGDDRLKTLTLLAAQTDFREAGELRTFVDESQLAILDDMMAEKGVLEASQMAGTFHLLRSNDLIWSRMIRRYLLGVAEPLDDLAAWSTDATRMPFRMHQEYLRSFYLDNDLAEGRIEAGGRTIDLQDVDTPLFAVGTEGDFVAPWKSVFKVHRLTSSDVTFVLASRGHNHGIIAPPLSADRHYRLATVEHLKSHVEPEEWLARAECVAGSWWPAWFKWLEAKSGGRTEPPPLGRPSTGYPAILDAPGSYVRG